LLKVEGEFEWTPLPLDTMAEAVGIRQGIKAMKAAVYGAA